MKKAIIIHGTKGSPNGNWFPWLKGELENRGVQVIVPAFPTPDGQSLTAWLSVFKKNAEDVDESTALIGHSVGGAFVLRVLERAPKAVGTVVIVAGFTGSLGIPEYDSLNATFVTAPFDWALICQNARRFVCISGSDDPYVPKTQGLEMAAQLQTPLTIIEGGGHLNSEFGFTEFRPS